MGFKFERPTGAGADVSELEYVSALLQTGYRDLRLDCSLKGKLTLVCFPNSSYAIEADPPHSHLCTTDH